jgi:asparaginyl-tRNA synthetase
VFAIEEKETETEKQYFQSKRYLTVSGQLHLEMVSSSLSRVYTFNPAFRAEVSTTSRHLSEFWMIEAEVAFINDVHVLCDLVERNLQQVLGRVYESSKEELEFLHHLNSYEMDMQRIITEPFARITYTKALKILEDYGYETKWGQDLNREQELLLADKVFNGPVFITNYPSEIKAFYMKVGKDNTAECFDLIFPFVGELVGGSLREDDHSKLKEKFKRLEINKNGDLDWYLELREFGCGPHGGYGIGFDRFVQFITGMSNIKDTCLNPRSFQNCKY